MELKERQETTIAQVTSTEVREDGITVSALSDMGRYGKVRFTINIDSDNDQNSGKAHGGGRGTLEDGTYLAGTFAGRWLREGNKITVYGIDQVTNGDVSLITFSYNASGNEISVTHYALN